MRLRALGALAALILASSARAVPEPEEYQDVIPIDPPSQQGNVRRWEYVVIVRTTPEVSGALGRAELAAAQAGGAVLADLRTDYTLSHSDYRLLVRTSDKDTINQVLRAVRTTPGVAGATVVPLPETATWAGSPSFMESYLAPTDEPVSNAGRVVMRHDTAPVADKQELLEAADTIATSPSLGPEGTGGFTLNVSELLSRWKESRWRKREDELRSTPIVILPPDGTKPTTSTP